MTRLDETSLERLRSFIESNLTDSLSLSVLAQQVHLSPFHFARMFKERTGQTPHKFVTTQRIERSKHLLTRTQMPLSEVARSVGYRTHAHFTGVFRRATGFTPKKYRDAMATGYVEHTPAYRARENARS